MRYMRGQCYWGGFTTLSLWMRYMRGQCRWGGFTTKCHCGWDTWKVSAAEVTSLRNVIVDEIHERSVLLRWLHHTVIVDEIHERSVLLRWLHYTVSLWMRYMRGQCCWGGFTTQCHCGWDTWEVSAAEVTSLHSVIVDEIHERSVLLRWLHYTVIVDEIHERSMLLRWLHYTVSMLLRWLHCPNHHGVSSGWSSVWHRSLYWPI